MNGTLNKVILIGRLGDAIKITRFDNGGVAGRVSLATDESYKNKEGQKIEATEWHNLEFWGKLAEVVEKYTKKGDKIQIEGKLKTTSYTRQGDTKESYFTSIRVDSMNLLGGGKSETTGSQPVQNNSPEKPKDDLPF